MPSHSIFKPVASSLPNMTVTVRVDDGAERSFMVTEDNALGFERRIVVEAADLKPGEHTVLISKEGKGTIYHSAYLDYYTKEDPITPEGHDLRISRLYYRVHSREVEKLREVWDAGAGRTIEETYRAMEDISRADKRRRSALSG